MKVYALAVLAIYCAWLFAWAVLKLQGRIFVRDVENMLYEYSQ